MKLTLEQYQLLHPRLRVQRATLDKIRVLGNAFFYPTTQSVGWLVSNDVPQLIPSGRAHTQMSLNSTKLSVWEIHVQQWP